MRVSAALPADDATRERLYSEAYRLAAPEEMGTVYKVMVMEAGAPPPTQMA